MGVNLPYKAVKENDDTYSIRYSKHGLSYHDVVQIGVRGCNVNRVIAALNAAEYERELLEKRTALAEQH